MAPQGSLPESPDGGVLTPTLKIWDTMVPRKIQLAYFVTPAAADTQKWNQGRASRLYSRNFPDGFFLAFSSFVAC